jgi:hypothetical protein
MILYAILYIDVPDGDLEHCRQYFTSDVLAESTLEKLIKENESPTSDFFADKNVYAFEFKNIDQLIEGLESLNYEWGRKNSLMAKGTSIEEKRIRMERLLYDLRAAVNNNQTFAFGPKLNNYKVNWSSHALNTRGILIEHDFVTIESAFKNQSRFVFTDKAQGLEIPDLAEIIVDIIERKNGAMDHLIPEVIEDEPAQEMIYLDASNGHDAAEETQELDEVEWAVIRVALRELQKSPSIYRDICEKILEKI